MKAGEGHSEGQRQDGMNHSGGLQISLTDTSKFSLRCGYSTLPLQIDSNSPNYFLWIFQSSPVAWLTPQGNLSDQPSLHPGEPV